MLFINMSHETISKEEPEFTVNYPVFISDFIQQYIDLTLYFFLSGSLAILGFVANVINIVIFIKQGLQESASVSLLWLSIWDLGVCITTLVFAVGIAIDRIKPFPNLRVYDLVFLVGSLPRSYLSELSMCTTVVLSLERCLCIIKPLTYRRIINKRNTMIILIVIFIETTAFMIPVLSSATLTWKYDNEIKDMRLVLDMYSAKAALEVKNVKFVFVTFTSVLIVLVCTGVMGAGLRSSMKFKQASTVISSQQPMMSATSGASEREARLVKLVTLISVIFIVSYIPLMSLQLSRVFVPELANYGHFKNLSETLWALLYLIGTCNSTFNIIVYYKVSFKYKQMFNQIICKKL